MALINCPECDAEISRNATSCPKCGNPINQEPPPEEKGGCLRWFIGVSLLLTLIAFTMDEDKTSKPASLSEGAVSRVASGSLNDWLSESVGAIKVEASERVVKEAIKEDILNQETLNAVATKEGIKQYSYLLFVELDESVNENKGGMALTELAKGVMQELGWLK